MPCKVNVYVDNGQVHISTIRPGAMVNFFPEAGLQELAAEVDRVLLEIVDESR